MIYRVSRLLFEFLLYLVVWRRNGRSCRAFRFCVCAEPVQFRNVGFLINLAYIISQTFHDLSGEPIFSPIQPIENLRRIPTIYRVSRLLFEFLLYLVAWRRNGRSCRAFRFCVCAEPVQFRNSQFFGLIWQISFPDRSTIYRVSQYFLRSSLSEIDAESP